MDEKEYQEFKEFQEWKKAKEHAEGQQSGNEVCGTKTHIEGAIIDEVAHTPKPVVETPEKNKKPKSKKRIIIVLAIVVVVIGTAIGGICWYTYVNGISMSDIQREIRLSFANKKDFNAMVEKVKKQDRGGAPLSPERWYIYSGVAKVSNDGKSITVTRPYRSEGDDDFIIGINNEIVSIYTENLNRELGLPDSLNDMFDHTRAIDGTQVEDYGWVKVSWSYHPNSGITVIYAKK